MHVALLDGSNAAADCRGAQLGTILASYKPKGLEEESFAGKKANVLDAARLATLTAFIEESRRPPRSPASPSPSCRTARWCWRRASA